MKTRTELPKQEELLVDYAERLRRHRKGRCALHLRLSGLMPHNRKDHHIRIAQATLDPLVKRFEGQIFCLSNADIVYVGKNVSRGELDDAVLKIRYMFRDDPFVERSEDPECGESFYTYYKLDFDYAAFHARAEELRVACESLARAAAFSVVLAPDEDEEAARKARHPLDPTELGRLEKALANLDLTSVLRKQYVYAIIGNAPPQPILCERYVSIPAIQRLLLPEYNLRADPWLFQRLTAQLDRRVMLDLLEMNLTGDVPASINMHVANILSREFLPFITALKRRIGKSVLVEIPVADLIEDTHTFMFARDFLRANGQKICIDGLDPMIFTALDRTVIQADLEKVKWSPEYKDQLLGDWRKGFERAIESAGAAHVVLCHCDDSMAIEFGQSVGIRLFQGRYVDSMALNRQPAKAQAG